jgi:hypothetical protein
VSRLLTLLCFVFAAQAVHACSVRIAHPVQVLTRRSHVIVEGTATGGRFEIEVSRLWKGEAGGTVRLLDVSTDVGSCDWYPPLVEGQRYLFFIQSAEPKRDGSVDVFPGRADIMNLSESPSCSATSRCRCASRRATS